MDYLTLTIGKQKKIALIAHDSKKRELIGWCDAHKEILKHHFLCGTGTTARMVTDATGFRSRAITAAPWAATSRSAQRSWKAGWTLWSFSPTR